MAFSLWQKWMDRGSADALRNAPLPTAPGAGNPRGMSRTTISLPGTARNYVARAGDLWASSIVMAAAGWVGSNIHQAPLVGYRAISGHDKPARYSRGQGRDLERLLARPNKFYSYQVLMSSTMLSLIVEGNAYWYIIRNLMGQPIELWYIPHNQIEPAWQPGATTEDWISHYTYRQNGQIFDLPNEDVIHFREGALDPRNPRKSLSRLATALRQIATDHEISNYEAAILSNSGVPGLVIQPGDATVTATKEDMAEIRDMAYDRISGDERGKPLTFTAPVKIDQIGFSPEQLLLGDAGDAGEARVCALIGINPVVLALSVGLKHSTYSNQEQAQKAAWETGIIPRLMGICGELNVQLVPLYDLPDDYQLGPDLSSVPALAPSADALYKRLKDGVGGPWLTIEEGRELAGMGPISPDDLARLEELRSKSAKPAGDPTVPDPGTTP